MIEVNMILRSRQFVESTRKYRRLNIAVRLVILIQPFFGKIKKRRLFKLPGYDKIAGQRRRRGRVDY